MRSGKTNTILKFNLLFPLTWIFSLLFYPVWVEPPTLQARSLIYIFTAVWTLINIILFHKFLLNTDIDPLPPGTFSIEMDNYFIVLISLLSLNFLLHLYPISFPLMLMDDEAAHASSGIGLISRFLWMKGLDPHKYFVFIRTGAWGVLLLTAVLLSLKRSRDFLQRIYSITRANPYILFAALFSISIIIFLSTKNMEFNLMLMRYPPIGKLLYASSISLFGINEFSVRIPQLLFGILSSIMIFNICRSSLGSKRAGLTSACCYAFSPIVFYYSALGELICGTVFFSILIIYVYLKYVKTNNNWFLIISFYLISIGFLYKRVIVLMLAVLVVSIFLLKENRVRLPFLFKLCYFSLVPIVPYLVIGKVYPNNPFGLDLANWFELGPALGYIAVLRKQLSYPLFALASVSMLFLLFRKMILKPAVFVFFTCFLLYYALYTSSSLNTTLYPYLYSIHKSGDFLIGTERYSMIFFPFISISIGIFIDKITKSLKWQHTFKMIFSALTLYLILICTVWQVPPLNAQFITYKNIGSNYYPSDDAMKWVKDNLSDEDKILILRVAPATFYREKYGIRRENTTDFWYDLDKVSTAEKLKKYYTENKITYIMFSYGLSEEAEILKYLKGYRGDEFSEVARFNIDRNYVFIYKIH